MASRRKRRHPVPIRESAGSGSRLLSFCSSRITWETAAPAILFLFGAYLAVLYFGHQAVPNSDFPAFVQTARNILHFRLPSSFKRLPGLGILQIALSTVVPGPYPVLTAGLLLNALLYPFCGLLLYGIARRFLGKGAFWVTLPALANPWVLSWLVHPIAELPLIFFILLTFYLLFEKGRWAYLAAFAASMIRYEGAVLIPIVFMWDLLGHRSWRQRLIAVGLAFAAGIPVALWILAQILSHESSAGQDYLAGYKAAAKGGTMVYGEFAGLVWLESIGAYFKIPPSSQEGISPADTVRWISQGLFVAGLLIAVGWGIYQKRWDVISLFLFAGVYFLVHASRTGTRPRYAVPIAWIVLLVCLYGIRSIWEIIQGKRRIPKPVIVGLQLTLCVVSIILAVSLIEKVSGLRKYSPRSEWIPLVALSAAILFAMIRLIHTKGRETGWTLAACGLTAFAFTINQIHLVPNMGNGAVDMEFKVLADWYLQNASPGEKMVTTMPHLLDLFAPEQKNNFVPTKWIEGDNPEDFIRDCCKRKITYVAWDSRLGLASQNAYYNIYKLNRIAFLGPRIGPENTMVLPPKKNGPFELIETIQNEYYPMRFIFIYRLNPLPDGSTEESP